jgi:ABC-type sulfate transport system substrate-binding protein
MKAEVFDYLADSYYTPRDQKYERKAAYELDRNLAEKMGVTGVDILLAVYSSDRVRLVVQDLKHRIIFSLVAHDVQDPIDDSEVGWAKLLPHKGHIYESGVILVQDLDNHKAVTDMYAKLEEGLVHRIEEAKRKTHGHECA